MSQQLSSQPADQEETWVVLEQEQRKLVCRALTPWDAFTLLACLSSDPRTLEELSQAWRRYRPQETLMDRAWMPLMEIEAQPAVQASWLWVDLTNCRFAVHGMELDDLRDGAVAPVDLEPDAAVLPPAGQPVLRPLAGGNAPGPVNAKHPTEYTVGLRKVEGSKAGTLSGSSPKGNPLAVGHSQADRSRRSGKRGKSAREKLVRSKLYKQRRGASDQAEQRWQAEQLQVARQQERARRRKLEAKQAVWLNIPPWWQHAEVEGFPSSASRLGSNGSQPGLEYRSVLYGRPLALFVAQQVLATQSMLDRADTAMEGGGSNPLLPTAIDCDTYGPWDDDLRESNLSGREKLVMAAIKRLHVQWLMTPHELLGGRTPREFLHENRGWKEREMDYRRNHWTVTRRPPPPVPMGSEQFRFGPMSTEEVVIYFELCRETIMMAWRWVDDQPDVSVNQLADDIERFIDGWLNAEMNDGHGQSAREIINQERQLVPRLASSEPLDCDCPICRMQSEHAELFGPAFSLCDGYLLELEGEFAFSLFGNRQEWEEQADLWREDWAPEDTEDEEELDEKVTIARIENVGQGWKSSYVSVEATGPTLALFSIGARLAELICELKSLTDTRDQIDGLNELFLLLGKSMRGNNSESLAQLESDAVLLDSVAQQLVDQLEHISVEFPSLTSQSADLQSLVHEWQRCIAVQNRM